MTEENDFEQTNQSFRCLDLIKGFNRPVTEQAGALPLPSRRLYYFLAREKTPAKKITRKGWKKIERIVFIAHIQKKL